MRIKTNSLLVILTFAFGIMLASTISAASVVVFGQKNQTNTGASSSSGNQTTTNVTPAGKEATRIINQTSVPANQTTTTVQKKTEPVGNVSIPSNNQLKLSPPGSQAKLPSVSNKTTVTPTGQATTTIINQTSTPLNVTSTNATTAAKQPQTAPSPVNQTASPSPSSSSSAGGSTSNQTAAKQQSPSPSSSSSAGGSSSNQTGNNTSANPLAKVPVIGKLFGGK
jgi:hypothetical protein